MLKYLVSDMTRWRRHLHSIPEFGLQERKTKAFLKKKFKEFNINKVYSFGSAGLLVILQNGKGPSIGFRADIDALPLEEKNNFSYRSQHPGFMHACGHDGHTAMLLGALKHLKENPNFKGRINFIFQSGEENGGGGKLMVQQGLFKRFPMDKIYALHNWPDLARGQFGLAPLVTMANADELEIKLKGLGGHAASPHQTQDLILTAAELIPILYSIIPRELKAPAQGLISITSINGGSSHNILPPEVNIKGSCRSLDNKTRNYLFKRIKEISKKMASLRGIKVEVNFKQGYPATINDTKETKKLHSFLKSISKQKVVYPVTPSFGGEDFSYFLQEVPGCYIRLGVNVRAEIHNDRYDFDDQALIYGANYWVKLAYNLLG